MRLSELVGIDLSDFRDDTIRILGKGGKERLVYLNGTPANRRLTTIAKRALPSPT